MKRLSLLLTLLCAFFSLHAELVYPDFSTEEAPVWYIVQFKTGQAVIADMGAGQQLKTAAKNNSAGQKWQLIGTKDNFKMKSAAGQYMNFSGGFFTAAATGVSLKLVASSNASAEGCFEIQRVGATQNMNQYQGAGAGRSLSEYAPGDPNNPLSFLPAQPKMPTFSTAESETWYYLRFSREGGVICDRGAGQNALIGAYNPYDSRWMWKFEGTKDNFQLISRDGNYAAVRGTGDATRVITQTTPYADGFKLHESANGTYAPAWELQSNSSALAGKSVNQWEGPVVGNQLGFWAADNDPNNPMTFIAQDDIVFPDYLVKGISGYRPDNALTLWYTHPATTTSAGNKWMEYSLPIGNGQLGASLFGGVETDEILFNEKTLWSGSITAYGKYQNFGSVLVKNIDPRFGYSAETAAIDYYRQLDLSTGEGRSGYKTADGSVTFTRRYIASHPDSCIAVLYTADKAGQINLHFSLQSGKPGVTATARYEGRYAGFSGKLDLVSYNARLRVEPKGGTLTTDADGITVRDADEVLLVLVGATDYDALSTTYLSHTATLEANVKARVDAAAAKGWDALAEAGRADHSALFGRVNLQLGNAENTVPTDELVDTYAAGAGAGARMLEQLYFAYGRYLAIGSSRGVDLPSNLQGIWNNSSTPPWSSDIHANINVQMNYWPVETTNLSEIHLPFLNYIINQSVRQPQWRANARKSGQTCGWTLYTENNIFGGGSTFALNYVIANAWYCTHLWQHYRYTLDEDFLARALPAMWSCSEFWMERLVKAADGTWECPKEYSPEHGPEAENATAHSQQLVTELFANTIQAVRILGTRSGVSRDDLARLEGYYEKLDKGLATETYSGGWGTDRIAAGSPLMREWKYSPYTASSDKNHRHMSHLMCLYPFNQVTPSSPYFTPAVNSMKLRGDASTGWSMGWKINLWARALNGDRAFGVLSTALRHSRSYGVDQSAGGIYYNLYDSHAPFQIDGNFGACSGIAEMLMQSHSDTIVLLPALPGKWSEGSVKGLKAVGDFTVNIDWNKGRAVKAVITSHKGRPLYITYPGISDRNVCVNAQPVSHTVISAHTIRVEAAAGDEVTVDFLTPSTGIATPTRSAQITVNGRTLTLDAPRGTQMRICDPAGRILVSTRANTVTAPEDWGHTLIVEAAGVSQKVMLK